MGELPPLHTPQGPGVPRASRPGFPRVDSSGTSSAPSSRSASFPFLASGSLHGPIQLPPRISPPSSTRVSLRFLPVPSPSLRPVPVGLSTSFLTPLPGSFSSPFHVYLLGIVLCLGCVFPPKGSVTFSSASSSVSSSFLPLPSPSFRPVLPSSLHSRPLRFSRCLPAHMAFRLFPFLLPDSGFRRRSLAARFLWPAGRAEAPPHHSREAAKLTGTGGIHKPISKSVQSTGNRGLKQ